MAHVYTDGSCLKNPGPGGWAFVVQGSGVEDSGGEPATTNNRMEVLAAMRALDAVRGDVTIHSDSKYVVDCFNKEWHVGWRRRGWRRGPKKKTVAVKNRDLWEPFVDSVLRRRKDNHVEFVWVRGHDGDAMNERADDLARAAAMRQALGAGESNSVSQ